MFKSRMAIFLGAVVGAVTLGAIGAIVSNSRAARRRRFLKRVFKNAKKVCCLMQRLISF